MEGFLPHPWWEIWFGLSFPVVAYGVHVMGKLVKARRETLPLLAVSGAFVFVLSSLKLPSVSGSCSHPTGTGLGSILFGPGITSVITIVVLVYQALFLAHGGLTTLGANVFSMGVAGPLAGYVVYKGATKAGLNLYFAVFLAAAMADLATYAVTAFQLALAFPAATGILTSFKAFMAVFAVTQIPLVIVEGAVTSLTFKYILHSRSDVLVRLNVVSEKALQKLREVSA